MLFNYLAILFITVTSLYSEDGYPDDPEPKIIELTQPDTTAFETPVSNEKSAKHPFYTNQPRKRNAPQQQFQTVHKKEKPAVLLEYKPYKQTVAKTTRQEPHNIVPKKEIVLEVNATLSLSVTGQGVAPTTHGQSPQSAYALAKRAATVDAYRLMAERIYGVRVRGKDLIKNMMIKNSTLHTDVSATIKDSSIVSTHYTNGLCEVTIRTKLSYNQFN